MVEIRSTTPQEDQIVSIDVGGVLTYIGYSRPGALTSESVWKIKKVTYSVNGSPTVKYANQSPSYSLILDNYLSYDYS